MLRFIEKNGFDLVKKNNSTEFKVIQNLIESIKAYLSGKKINLYRKIRELDIQISIKNKFPTNFAQKVVHYLAENINYGDFTTYSDIGKQLHSNAYRAIGNIMKKNPLPLIIPCHRVLRKNGTIGGFMGEDNKGWQTNLKLNLLRLEGIKDSQLKT